MLDKKSIPYDFIDFKKTPPDSDLIKKWLEQVDLDALINKRGTTWRKLADETKKNLDKNSSISIMCANPSIIKRPVTDDNGEVFVGLKCNFYEAN